MHNGVVGSAKDGYKFVKTQSLSWPKGTNLRGGLQAASDALAVAMDSIDLNADDKTASGLPSLNDQFNWGEGSSEWDAEEARGLRDARAGQRVTDRDYKDDVLRGVMDKHTGFPDLPDCPTEGLWGSYRKGYEPGQKAGNCKDTSIQQHVLKQRSTLVPSVSNWNKLWKQDIKALKRKASYAALTKDLWKHSAPSASMAYYLPSEADGSLKAFYERPQGESSVSNLAHINSISPGENTEYYNSDFKRVSRTPSSRLS